MNRLKIEYMPIDSLVEYRGNVKLHPEKQINQIVESIEQFGMNDPIAIWSNEIVEGHGRLLACKRMGLKTVPVIKLDDLTDEQRRAYALVHNQLTLNSGYDLEGLATELKTLKTDLTPFGLSSLKTENDILEKELNHEQSRIDTQFLKSNILNLERAQFDGVGPYDIPEIYPIQMDEIGQITEWIGFNYVLSDKNPEGKGVHFFIDDYQFERVWNNPEKYVNKLKNYAAVMSPDFSPYGDMPLITQLYNHYRKHWVARYWQENGINVIPTIRASTDPRSLDWYLDGEPEGKR